MEDQRRDRRKPLIYQLKVLDPKTKHQIGHLSDLSKNGCHLVIDHPIKRNDNLFIAIENVLDIEGGKTLAFSARCKWSRSDDQNDPMHTHYDAGLEFQNLPTDVKEIVQSFG
ncbi:MAG: PilZ domain-containing protein [Pseudomonadales bacterium]|nr:PilZ domain-containing protein [Pseudomonadales bacterium]